MLVLRFDLMEPRERHFGQVADAQSVDVGAIVRRLLLFEECTVDSVRFKEVLPLLNVFGLDGVISLLRSPSFRIRFDTRTFANTAQFRGKPLGTFELSTIRVSAPETSEQGNPDFDGDHRWMVRNALEEAQSTWQAIGPKKANELSSEVEDRAEAEPFQPTAYASEDTQHDLNTGADLLRAALVIALNREGLDVPVHLDVVAEQIGEGFLYRISSAAVEGALGAEHAHKLIEQALYGVVRVNHRIALMNAYNAVTGTRQDELPIFETKVQSVAMQLDPAIQEHRFDRVVRAAHLPTLDDLNQGTLLNMDRLLTLRADAELADFRQWLREVDSATDEEIEDRFALVNHRFARAVHDGPGKLVRFVTVTAAGIPNPVAGAAASAADYFLFEQLIRRPGFLASLGQKYRTIFEQ